MSTNAAIKVELAEVLKEQRELFKLLQAKDDKRAEFSTRYQTWYTRALKLVEFLGPDRLEEFVNYYRGDPNRQGVNTTTFAIQDFINGTGLKGDGGRGGQSGESKLVLLRIFNQFQILAALGSRIDSVLTDVSGRLLLDLLESELKEAEKLVKVNRRAAGVLAGVVLERHLLMVGRGRNIPEFEKSLAVSDCNDLLKEKGVYKVSTWKEIQSLVETFQACAQERISTPSEQKVAKLIEGTAKIIKSVP